MALGSIIFNKKQGGLGREPLTQDHISGMAIFATASNPLNNGVTEIQVFNETEAKDLGLTGDYLARVGEYFRINPNGNLYIGYYADTDDDDKILDLQDFAEGKIRQCLVVRDTEAFVDNLLSSLQAVADTLENIYRPTQFLLEADFSNYVAGDVTSEGRKNVTTVLGKSINVNFTAAVTCLGAISRQLVSESVAHVDKNNIASGDMYDKCEILGKDLLKYTETELSDLADKSFLTIRKFSDYKGVYFATQLTADLQTSDYKKISLNRTIDKALRELRKTYIGDLSSQAYINKDGTIKIGTVAYFESKGQRVLDILENNLEISGGEVSISANQNILQTGKLIITAKIIPIGQTDTLVVNLGFTTNI